MYVDIHSHEDSEPGVLVGHLVHVGGHEAAL